ncbi:unnamed protein product [Closterium sp. Naga37s-1]|nr:unnamed protein product [Closterium sp. Naga37s-1]
MAFAPRHHGHSKSQDALVVPVEAQGVAASSPRMLDVAQTVTASASRDLDTSASCATNHECAASISSRLVNCDRFSVLPDDLLVEILSRLGGSAADVSVASMTCRRWRALARQVPSLSFGGAADSQQSSTRFEESISRMVLRSESLRQLKIVTPLPASSPAPRACAACGSVSASAIPPACPCFEETAHGAHGAHGATAQEGDSATASHPREFIFEAWMRHVGPSLRSLTLSRAVPVATSTNCGGDGSVVVNLWEEEDASLHLANISRHCTNLRSLSLGHVSLSAPTLLATLQPMPALQHLSLSWLHACPAALHAVLDAAPNLRHLTFFMASGLPRLHLRLPPSLQHLSLSYIRADSVTLHSAHSLQSLSIRDMFLRSLSIRDAPNLRQLSVASANSLLVSAPHSSRLASIDLRAGSLNWAATETLISTNWAALESLSLDFFATTNASSLPSVSSLPWLARNCPGLKSLRLGALAWQNMVDSAALSGLLLPQRSNDNLWPRLEALTVRIAEKAPEGLLLLHSILSNIPTLMGLHVTVEGEEDEEEEEEAEEMEYDGDCDAMSMDEDEEEDEGNNIPEEASDFSHTPSEASASPGISGVADAALAEPTQPVGYWPALTAAERQHQLFLKGLDCLQRRSGDN